MIHKVFPDIEKTKSIFKMALEREKSLLKLDYKLFATIIAENYYEIIKELSTALLLLEGIKFVGENAHKEIIDGMKKYADFSEEEISISQDLRIIRNKSMYECRQVNPLYLENNRYNLLKIIDKLKKIVGNRLK